MRQQKERPHTIDEETGRTCKCYACRDWDHDQVVANVDINSTQAPRRSAWNA